MYDLDGDGCISREELLAVLHMMVGANISEEQVSMRCLGVHKTFALMIFVRTQADMMALGKGLGNLTLHRKFNIAGTL